MTKMKDSSFTEISVDLIIASHPNGLTELCVDMIENLCTYLVQPRIPHLMKPRIRPICFCDAFGQQKFVKL